MPHRSNAVGLFICLEIWNSREFSIMRQGPDMTDMTPTKLNPTECEHVHMCIAEAHPQCAPTVTMVGMLTMATPTAQPSAWAVQMCSGDEASRTWRGTRHLYSEVGHMPNDDELERILNADNEPTANTWCGDTTMNQNRAWSTMNVAFSCNCSGCSCSSSCSAVLCMDSNNWMQS